MAAATPPTFKLVLVGDGGTGKVGFHDLIAILDLRVTLDRRPSSRDI